MFRFAAVFVALLAIASAAPVTTLETVIRQGQAAANETEVIEPSATPIPTTTAQPSQTPQASKNPKGDKKKPAPADKAPAAAASTTPMAPVADAAPASSTTEVVDEDTMPTPSPENTGAPCFPASATVQLEDGSVKKMSDLVVGDRVNVGKNQFSDVFMFTHKLASVKYSFVQLKTASGATLRLTDGHFLPINGQYLPAKRATVGDELILADGSVSNVVDITTVQDSGLFNPQTTHGDIVVDGVQASTYTTAVAPNMAHALLAPLRTICNRFGMEMRFLESGADSVARFTSIAA